MSVFPRPTVCQVLHTLKVGGAEVLAARLARQLAGEFRFLFLCLDDLGTLGEQLRQEGFPVQVLHRRQGLDARCIWRFAAHLRRERVDLLHAHQYTPFFYSIAARLLCRRPPLLLTEHGRHFPDYPRPRRKAFNRLLLENRDRVVAVGQAVRQALLKNEGMPASRVEVIYNGVDLAPFLTLTTSRAQVRHELGLPAEAFVLFMVARLDYLKDHATALHTLHRVRQEHAHVRLVLVGDGPEESAIRQRTKELGLDDYVLFLGLRKDVARLMPAADLFLLTSISEGIPLTLIEGMAAGLPIVSTDVGGIPEVVEDGVTGFLAPAQDAAALAERIQRLVPDTTLRHQLGAAGRARALALFTEQRMHDQYRTLYRAMLRR